jgi:succinyl-CoA synthetase beta subunit
MKLYEFQGKALFKKYNVTVPNGTVVTSPEELKEITGPVALKSQVLVGGRGKAGGIKFANDLNSGKMALKELFNTTLKGSKVKYVLIEDKLNIDKELYVSILMDRGTKSPTIIASREGGVEIENVEDSKIIMKSIDPLIGYSPFIGNMIGRKLQLTDSLLKQFSSMLSNLYRLFIEYDAELVEINPLVITKEGKLIAADSKVIIDSDSLFRHKDVQENEEDLTELEKEARSQDYAFVELDGEVGVIANGAGLTMATLDTLLLHKLKPRNFLDLGGTDSIEIVKNAFPLVLKARPKLILVNIFGGVTKCDTVAKGIVAAKNEFKVTIPMVVRLSGVHEEEGRDILKENGINAYSNMTDAVKKVAELDKEVS